MNDEDYAKQYAAGWIPGQNRVAIAFSTKDRVELSRRSLGPLWSGRLDIARKNLGAPDEYDLFWIDGSTTPAGLDFFMPAAALSDGVYRYANVRGGADAAIVFSLTTMLNHPNNYTHVGLVENDVLLDSDWFLPTMALFERGAQDGLNVGAVSARCYEDRVLIQRQDYAICHNLGAGMVIFTRKAAQIALDNFRTTWWTFNRRTFAQLSGIDIGKYAAFRANEQWCCADWGIDANLVSCGFASLALTPSKCQMIGQIPSLAEQGLKLVTESDRAMEPEQLFSQFRNNLIRRANKFVDLPNRTQFHQHDDGSWLIFPHQIAAIGGKYEGDWRLKWAQGYGPFAYRADRSPEMEIPGIIPTWSTGSFPTLTVPVSGPCSFMVSGGEKGGRVKIEDTASGYTVDPLLPPEGTNTSVLNLAVPSGVSYRDVRLTMLTPGCVFYGLQTREPQPCLMNVSFDHNTLPPP